MDGWNLVILIVLFAGHCELMAAWVNRLHALPLKKSWLSLSQRVHDGLVIGFLPYTIWRFGFGEPHLLTGGSWPNLPFVVLAYFALCAAGVLSLLWAIIRRWLRRPEPVTESRIQNVGSLADGPITEPGWRGWIARCPGNEAATIEINEKQIVCPGLPTGWEGLSIAHISDVHFHDSVSLEYFRYVFGQIAELRADMICFTGDLLDDPDRLAWTTETFGLLSAPLGCWFILGNHDSLVGASASRQNLTSLGWQDLGGQSILLKDGGKTIWLAGDESPWIGKPFGPQSAPEADFRILLSHTPDHFPRAQRLGIDLTLAGHNHGGQICLPLIGPVYSPSHYGVKYAGGTFRDGDSVMHVSRGVSAKRPLRWNCPPEATRLVLTRASHTNPNRQRENESIPVPVNTNPKR